MRRFHVSPLLATALAMLGLVLLMTTALQAQTLNSLDAEFATISRTIVDRQPFDARTTYSASVGQLYCFTRIVNAQPPTEVTHVWYYQNVERARVTLPVNSNSWRTYSSKIIQLHEAGQWYVDVLDAEGDLIVSLPFTITH